MTHSHPLIRPVACAGLVWLACLTTPMAHAEDNPLSLTLSETLRHDSNFSRNAEQQAETISTTTVGVGLNKDYGRQSYRAFGSLGAQRYSHYKNLKNDVKNANASITSGIASNWNVSLGGAYSENLNPIQDNNNTLLRVARNIRKYTDQNMAVQYGNGGRWSLTGSLDGNRLSYSEPAYQYQNAIQKSQGLRANYYASDVLNFGLGTRQVKTRYPFNGNEEITDHNIDLSTGWVVTGVSSFQGQISRRNSQYAVTDRRTKGVDGALTWNYTPRGLVTYSAGLSRSSGADRYKAASTNAVDNLLLGLTNIDYNFNTITTALNLGARLQATGKLDFGVGYNYNKFDTSRQRNGLDDANALITSDARQFLSHYRTVSLSANYAATRAIKLGCTLSKYDQTADNYRLANKGQVVDCNASLTID